MYSKDKRLKKINVLLAFSSALFLKRFEIDPASFTVLCD